MAVAAAAAAAANGAPVVELGAGVQLVGGMSAKTDVNRRVLAIQAKKKRHKPSKRKGKANSQGEQDAQSSKGPRVGGQVAAATTTTATVNAATTTTTTTATTYEFVSDGPMQRAYSDNGTR